MRFAQFEIDRELKKSWGNAIIKIRQKRSQAFFSKCKKLKIFAIKNKRACS
jgi:hypothetical protein